MGIELESDKKICEECGGVMLYCDKHDIFHHAESYEEECQEYEDSLTYVIEVSNFFPDK